MRTINILFMALIATTVLWAADFEVDGIAYNQLGGDSIEVTSKSPNYSGSVTIPATVTYSSTTYRVTSIGDYAFNFCDSLTSITIPNSVTNIGERAFEGCYSISSITIPNSVTSIGDHAFLYCTTLNSITIPNSVTNIGERAFMNCHSLTSITIPNGVTNIGIRAFRSCDKLISINIPHSVNNIGKYTFAGCSSLTSVTIPNSVTSIEERAFSECTSLTSVTIPHSLTSIGNEAFAYCTSITSITCYATTPPTCGEICFYDVTKSIPLYVPANSIDAYKAADEWKEFTNIEAIAAKEVTEPVTAVITIPDNNSVTITWPTTTGADSYTLVIYKDGVPFCTLTFNAQGQLTNIAFAPGRGSSNDAVMAEEVAGGYKFTITSLTPGTKYTYEVDTKNTEGTSIANYTGTFTTTGSTNLEETSFPSGEDRGEACKFIRNGQLYILHEGKTYNAQGGEL